MFCVVRHARVGQKMSEVNDAELPHLEGLSRNVTESGMVDVTYCHTCISLNFVRPKLSDMHV